MKNKKNRYLFLFNIGLLIVLVPQILIFVNELKHEYEHTQYQEWTVQNSEWIQTELQPQLDDAISYEWTASNSGNQPTENDSRNEMSYIDPFTQVAAAESESPLTKQFPNNIIGFIEIPKIGERLPIYIGATDYHLSLGAATVDGTSLPGGGPSTHTVISAHRGYAGANFFRHIDLLKAGDRFTITILDNVLTYEVTDTTIISPEDSSKLQIREGEDLVTLLSCHPYRVNDMRILIHAKRVPQQQASIFTKYQNLVASTDTTSLRSTTIEQEGGMNEFNIQTIIRTFFKFTDTTLAKEVRVDLMWNRLIILFGTIAIVCSTGLMIRNQKVTKRK